MPIEDPARAGLTNTGYPSSSTASRTAARPSSVAQSRGRTTSYGPTSNPAWASSRFMNSLSMETAEASTPEPT